MNETNNSSMTNEVKSFWNENPCGSNTSSSKNRKEYYQEIEQYRYNKIPSIKEMANFKNFNNKKILEIGCGVGTDGRQFTANGAIYTGINIDDNSTQHVVTNFDSFNLIGKFCTMNAEELKFDDNTFEHIYSHGVIHHSPKTNLIVKEMFRVLVPSGTVNVMVYNKSSINYYFEIMFLRKIFRNLLFIPKSPRILSKLTGFDYDLLMKHKTILTNRKLTHQEWVSINTDGPDCPLAKVYNKKEAEKIFHNAGFVNVEQQVRYFNKSHYSFIGKMIPNFVADILGNWAGWHRWIKALKPK